MLRRPLSGHAPGSDRVGHVSRFCDLFLNGRTALQGRPYISGCGDPEISIVPPEHRTRLESIENHVNGARDQLDALAVEDGGSGPIPADTQAFADTLARSMEVHGRAPASKPGNRKPRR